MEDLNMTSNKLAPMDIHRILHAQAGESTFLKYTKNNYKNVLYVRL